MTVRVNFTKLVWKVLSKEDKSVGAWYCGDDVRHIGGYVEKYILKIVVVVPKHRCCSLINHLDAFDSTKQHKIEQHNTKQNNIWQTFMLLNNFWWIKDYFCTLDNICVRQKVEL